MKNQLEKLAELSKTIDMDLFYVVSFRDIEISLQGKACRKSLLLLSTLGGTPVVDSVNGWISLSIENLRIVLTHD